MKARRRTQCFIALLLAMPLVPAACGADGIVGGECRAGFANCRGICTPVTSDPENCGACSRECEDGFSCIAAQCVLPDGSGGRDGGDAALDGDANPDQSAGGDGSNPDGSNPDGSDPDGSDPDSSRPDGSDPDADLDADLDAEDPDAECLPPFNTPSRCGDCETRCTAEEFCSPVAGGFACIPCDPPLKRCGNICVNLETDPFNCGRCGNVCPTRLCQGGFCVGASPGHLVLMCSNYAQTPGDSPHTRALANAVFTLRPANPVKILAYQQFTPGANKAKVDGLIAGAAAGRPYELTPAVNSSEVVANLNIQSYDVLLVYDQPTAPAGTLATIGTSFNLTLTSFARAGGVVIVQDSGTGRAEMSTFLSTAGLLNVTGEREVNSTPVYNRAPLDAVGIGVLSPYLSQAETCTFETVTRPGPDTAFVITTATEDGTPGDPVIVHRVVLPN